MMIFGAKLNGARISVLLFMVVFAAYFRDWWLVVSVALVALAVILPEGRGAGTPLWVIAICAVLLVAGLVCLFPGVRLFPGIRAIR